MYSCIIETEWSEVTLNLETIPDHLSPSRGFGSIMVSLARGCPALRQYTNG